MGHQETYQQNENYARFLEGWEQGFYAKYTQYLAPSKTGAKVLDVGCGVGQVVGRLTSEGYEAYGVDVSQPNIERARKVCPRCQVYDGRRLPFETGFFACAGSFNVLEHVEAPEEFLRELVRVVEPGGRVVISSPNFLRVLGFRDYHPRMRGFSNKWCNFVRLMQKRSQIRQAPDSVAFDRMAPIERQPFQPDDDAIVVTNAMEMAFFLNKYGCEVELITCTDRPVSSIVNWFLNVTPLKYLMFNAFVVARKK